MGKGIVLKKSLAQENYVKTLVVKGVENYVKTLVVK